MIEYIYIRSLGELSKSRNIVRSMSVFCFAILVLGFGRADAEPIVHSGDTISVEVHNYAALMDDANGRHRDLTSSNLTVAADGSVSIPIIGTVHVEGKTVREISKVVEQRLAVYVRDPSVDVRLLQQSQLIFLTGATTGTLPYLPDETLASALGQLREQLEKDEGPALNFSD